MQLRDLYLSTRFFQVWGGFIFLFCLSFALPWLYWVALGLFFIFLGFVVFDSIYTFQLSKNILATRQLTKVLSLGSPNPIVYEITNENNHFTSVTLKDEWPDQFQERTHSFQANLDGGETKAQSFDIFPLTRGSYQWGKIRLFVRSKMGMAEIRKTFPSDESHPVVPSIIEMKKFELRALTKLSQFQGVKKMRRLGHSYEFEQIRTYVRGDEIRSINWKATAKAGSLRVNQFSEEKSQQIYSVIDISRGMQMPFHGMSLLDYAVNAALVLSNVATGKEDKAGLITFSHKDELMLKAEKGALQMRKILDGLYKVEDIALEADYERMYQRVRRGITQRSLLFLYTNVLSKYALERNIPVLRKLARLHVLVVVMFENSEISDFIKEDPQTMEDLYVQTLAEQINADKLNLAGILKQYGIQVIVTRPEQLTVNSVNRYLELKARGVI